MHADYLPTKRYVFAERKLFDVGEKYFFCFQQTK